MTHRLNLPSRDDFRNGERRPQTREAWVSVAEACLTVQPCVFHRNLEISSLYAQLYLRFPDLFKWAGMAAFASHHARLALLPLISRRDDDGVVDLAWLEDRRHLRDINTIRSINNGIFEDIFWAHLAYGGTEDGLDHVMALLAERDDMRRGFELIERGRRAGNEELIWEGNLKLLWHEQAASVQPRFDTLSSVTARIFSLSASLTFQAKGLREHFSFGESFYTFMLLRRPGMLLATRRPPRINDLQHRWAWIEARLVPRFRRLESMRPDLLRERLELIASMHEAVHRQGLCDLGAAIGARDATP